MNDRTSRTLWDTRWRAQTNPTRLNVELYGTDECEAAEAMCFMLEMGGLWLHEKEQRRRFNNATALVKSLQYRLRRGRFDEFRTHTYCRCGTETAWGSNPYAEDKRKGMIAMCSLLTPQHLGGSRVGR